MIKAVIFDLDDTLISEKQYIESGYHHVSKVLAKKYGMNESEIYIRLLELFKENSKFVFNRLLDAWNVPYSDQDIKELVDEYRNHLPQISFYDDVIPCLNYLKSKNIKTGIITDGFANAQRQKLKAVKADQYFDEIIVTDELGREFWKPHPKSFELMSERLNLEYNMMIYVGDNPSKDFYISNIHPITTVRVRRREGMYEYNSFYFEDKKEHHLISNLSELIRLLN